MDYELETYPGSYSEVEQDRVKATRFLPGDAGYSRFVTLEKFVPPVRVAGWMILREHSGPRSGAEKFDGLHVHLAHVGNGRNYVCSLVRRDGHSKISVEYGWRGYTDIWTSWGMDQEGPEFKPDRLYHFDVRWYRGHITTWVANEMGVWEMNIEVPDNRIIPMGAVGFRLDNIDAIGDFRVRPL